MVHDVLMCEYCPLVAAAASYKSSQFFFCQDFQGLTIMHYRHLQLFCRIAPCIILIINHNNDNIILAIENDRTWLNIQSIEKGRNMEQITVKQNNKKMQ